MIVHTVLEQWLFAAAWAFMGWLGPYAYNLAKRKRL
jgi:hypothetical protein